MPSQPDTASKSTERRILILGLGADVGAGALRELMVGMATVEGFLLARETPSVAVPKISPVVDGFSDFVVVFCVLRISSSDHTMRPSMPPSTEIHCPEMWPAAR